MSQDEQFFGTLQQISTAESIQTEVLLHCTVSRDMQETTSLLLN